MALKNDQKIPPNGKRMLGLMAECGFHSSKELAKALLDKQLVHVNSREDCFNSPETMRNNAVLSVEKKINRHIKTGLYGDDSGEYILGYCKLFDCASDYLLGLTDIRSTDIEVRRICEKTGLKESTVIAFVKGNDSDSDFEYMAVPGWWSFILSSDLLYSIPNDCRIGSETLMECYRLRGEILKAKWTIEHGSDLGIDYDSLVDEEFRVEKMEEQINQMEPHLQGMLYKISRDLTSTLEREIVDSNKRLHEDYFDRVLQRHIHFMNKIVIKDEE